MLNDNEWPTGVIKHMAPKIISTAKQLRLKSGAAMVPSPDPEAHVRFTESGSRHSVYEDKLSDATDLFLVSNDDAARVWNCALSMPDIGGLGIYFDAQLNGKMKILFHIDNRPDRLMWVCPSRNRAKEKRSYIYFREDNPSVFLELLAQDFSKLRA